MVFKCSSRRQKKQTKKGTAIYLRVVGGLALGGNGGLGGCRGHLLGRGRAGGCRERGGCRLVRRVHALERLEVAAHPLQHDLFLHQHVLSSHAAAQ